MDVVKNMRLYLAEKGIIFTEFFLVIKVEVLLGGYIP